MDRSSHLDTEREASGSHTIATDVVDGFERKSFELLEYINTLESKLEQQRREFKQKERQLEGEKICVEQKLEISQLENARLQHDHHNFAEETERTIQCLRREIDAADSSLRKERRRAQDLDNNVTDLKQQVLQKQQFYDCRKANDEKEMCRLEEQVNMLRRKVSLGWILGRLSEAYLRMEPLLQQGRREGSGSVERSGADKDYINMDRIEKEVRCLIESSCPLPETPKANDTATRQQEMINWDEEGSESENDEEFQRRSINLRSIRRSGESASPSSRDIRNQRSNNADQEVSTSRARQSCDGSQNYVEAEIEITTESETLSRVGQKHDIQPAPNNAAQRPHGNSHSKSPSRGFPKSPMSSSSSPPQSSCKKDRYISRGQRDIHKLISKMKSEARIRSTSTNFIGDD